MNPLQRAVRAVDDWQQRHTVPGFLFAVVKKFGDDNGGVLAANLAFVAFGALFPLLLLLTTILGLVLAGDAHLRTEVLKSALAEFPVIGNQLGQNIHSLKARSTPALIISIVGLVWTSIGMSQAALFTMSQVWNLPNSERPDYVHRLVRSLAFLGVMAVGLAVTTGLASFGSNGGHPFYAVAAVALAALVNVLQYVLAFRVLTASSIATRKLWPGAIVGGLAWTLLQLLGGYLVGHQLHGASEVYGTFAMVIGLIAWVFLGVRVTVYAAEINTVIDRRLWPRSIIQPPLTPADKESIRLQEAEVARAIPDADATAARTG